MPLRAVTGRTAAASVASPSKCLSLWHMGDVLHIVLLYTEAFRLHHAASNLLYVVCTQSTQAMIQLALEEQHKKYSKE